MLRMAKTENGWVEGLPAADPRVTAFKGIPFAAPPVGKLRFHAPVKASNWDDIYKAHHFAPISLQPTPGLNKDDIYTREWSVDPDIPMSEDCLYLNVWTPAHTTDEKLPVYVWYFGGGWQLGSTAEMEFDGERFARRGIIVVTVNYRVNVFGFLAHKEITKENPDQPTNFGLLDQQFGLQWVKRNIAAFGGDPDNITIGGQSAGGGSVMSHIVCEQNRGLFQKAIIQSGIFVHPYQDIFPTKTLEQAEQIGEKFFELLGVKTLEEARELESSYILQKWHENGGFWTSVNLWGPVREGKYITDHFLNLYAEGKHVNVPLLIGYTSDEFIGEPIVNDLDEMKALAESLCGEDANEYLSIIGYEDSSLEDMKKKATLNTIEYGIRSLAKIKETSKTNQDMYMYEFAVDIPGWDNPGRFHSVDLWFTFETLAKCWRPFVGSHYDIARQMCNYWTNFIKSGNPNGCDITGEMQAEWRPFTSEHPNKMLFEDTSKPVIAETDQFMDFMLKQSVKKYGKSKK